jgi:tetratricopeptide (TPR) repeat protein
MYLYSARPEEAIELAEKGIRLSPTDPRMFIWLPAVAGAHYQLRNYEQAIEIGRRSWTLNRNWPAGLRYVVAGLAELGRIEEARVAVAELRLLNPNLAFVEGNLRRLFTDRAAVDHVIAGLRKAGFRVETCRSWEFRVAPLLSRRITRNELGLKAQHPKLSPDPLPSASDIFRWCWACMVCW